jgi:hypothetical protein
VICDSAKYSIDRRVPIWGEFRRTHLGFHYDDDRCIYLGEAERHRAHGLVDMASRTALGKGLDTLHFDGPSADLGQVGRGAIKMDPRSRDANLNRKDVGVTFRT